MIVVADEIFEEIKTEVILLNGEVVRRAFGAEKKRRENDRNWNEFHRQKRKLSNQYELAKSAARSAWQKSLDPITLEERRDAPVWRIRSNRFACAAEWDSRRDELLAKLRKLKDNPYVLTP